MEHGVPLLALVALLVPTLPAAQADVGASVIEWDAGAWRGPVALRLDFELTQATTCNLEFTGRGDSLHGPSHMLTIEAPYDGPRLVLVDTDEVIQVRVDGHDVPPPSTGTVSPGLGYGGALPWRAGEARVRVFANAIDPATLGPAEAIVGLRVECEDAVLHLRDARVATDVTLFDATGLDTGVGASVSTTSSVVVGGLARTLDADRVEITIAAWSSFGTIRLNHPEGATEWVELASPARCIVPDPTGLAPPCPPFRVHEGPAGTYATEFLLVEPAGGVFAGAVAGLEPPADLPQLPPVLVDSYSM